MEFKDYKESIDGEEIYAVVRHSGVFIRVRYKHKGTPYYLEFPKTKKNKHLKEGDEIEMQLTMIKEKK